MMLSLNDDDELDLSPSDPRKFTRADQGRKEAADERKTHMPMAKKASRLKLSVLKGQIQNEGKKDEETKRQSSETFTTKNRQQEEEEVTLDASTQQNADQMIVQGTLQKDVKEEQQKSGEVQTNMG